VILAIDLSDLSYLSDLAVFYKNVLLILVKVCLPKIMCYVIYKYMYFTVHAKVFHYVFPTV